LFFATAALGGATTVTIGALQLAPDNPSTGLLSFIFSNISGPGNCDATFNSCTSLFIDNGVLEVDYIDSVSGAQVFLAYLPNGFGPGDTDPSVFPDFTVDPTTWTIGLVTFSGTITPTSVFLFDGSSVDFQPVTFTGSFDASVDSFVLLTANADVAGSGVPEPSGFVLGAMGLAAIIGKLWVRRHA